jgi:hypothetical protein
MMLVLPNSSAKGDHVHNQITKVVTIMKRCENMQDLRQNFSTLFNRSSQPEFTLSQWLLLRAFV